MRNYANHGFLTLSRCSFARTVENNLQKKQQNLLPQDRIAFASILQLRLYNVPLVLGTAPPKRSSMQVAASSARPNALNSASTLW